MYHWQELGCFQFIVKDLPSAQMQQYIQEHLGPILKEKKAVKRAEELATLEALILKMLSLLR